MDPRVTWLVNGKLVTPRGIVRGALGVRGGRIVAMDQAGAGSGTRIDVRGRYIAPWFLDVHIWGEPSRIAVREPATGTTGFLSAVGPEPPELLVNHLVRWQAPLVADTVHAHWFGIHLEGPFLNPLRAGALASRWLRPPTSRELRQLLQHADGQLKLLTMAPEMPRALEAIRWCARHRIAVSLGHSDADGQVTRQAIQAGAKAVTHVFNGMRPLHHRDPGLLGEVLTDDRLMAMVILDGVHVSPVAFQLLLRCKGPDRIILVTDSIRHQRNHAAKPKRGAFYVKPGVLAGSRLTMIGAVRNAVRFGHVSVSEAVQMASRNPARLLGLDDECGSLAVGKRADIVVFEANFRVWLTLVDGQIAYRRARAA